jgi:hypothetical protein
MLNVERYYGVTGKTKETECPPERAFDFSKSLTFGRGKVPLANMPSKYTRIFLLV